MENKNSLNLIDDNILKEFRDKLQGLSKLLNREPNQEELKRTPDGKANYIPISFIEMTLDEVFFGLWETENFKWEQIANEIVGSIDLIVTHPMTGKVYKRVGAGAIQIMVDKVPDSIAKDPKAKNLWALDMQNKKPTALDMGFPKLKAECLKNAASSLGKLFGRDLNRNHSDIYKPLQVPKLDEVQSIYNEKKELLTIEEEQFIIRIIESKDVNSYEKIINHLKNK